MILKLSIIGISGLLFWLGGRKWSNKMFRRAGIPFVLGLYFAFAGAWWLFFAIGGSLALTICVGYGEPDAQDDKPSFLGKIFRIGWLIRGIYGAIVALASSVWLFAFGFIALPIFIGYIALNFAIGTILCKFKTPDFIIEPFVGIGLGSIVLIV